MFDCETTLLLAVIDMGHRMVIWLRGSEVEGALPCVTGQGDGTAGRSLVSVTTLHLIQLPCSYHGLALLAGYLALSV